ncbi:MAG TPA: hypothetical protein VGM64_20455 [Lacunisphaera sp.]|jgi:hypothetical protein
MKTAIKTIAAIVFFAIASVAWASPQYSIGHVINGSITIEITPTGSAYGTVSIYKGSDLMFECDTSGVLYAATGVSWSQDGTSFVAYDLPEGDYTADLTVPAPTEYEFSDYGQYTEIRAWSYYDEIWADFFVS